MSERCGIGRRYGCVDAEQPCGSRDSVSAQCKRSAVGPSRRDRGALKRCGRLELVHPAHDMPCASLQFEKVPATTPRGDVWPKKAHIGPRALCCCAARPRRAAPKSWLRGPLAALREGQPPPGARSARKWSNSANRMSSGSGLWVRVRCGGRDLCIDDHGLRSNILVAHWSLTTIAARQACLKPRNPRPLKPNPSL